MQPGAAAVFLDFISYSDGPLPDELLEAAQCPVSILWGEKDPWEPVAAGRAMQKHSCVEEFVPLPGVRCCALHLFLKMVVSLSLSLSLCVCVCVCVSGGDWLPLVVLDMLVLAAHVSIVLLVSEIICKRGICCRQAHLAHLSTHVIHAGVGHCGMDEEPDMVNPLILRFVQRHS